MTGFFTRDPQVTELIADVGNAYFRKIIIESEIPIFADAMLAAMEELLGEEAWRKNMAPWQKLMPVVIEHFSRGFRFQGEDAIQN